MSNESPAQPADEATCRDPIVPEATRAALTRWAIGVDCRLLVLFGSAADRNARSARDIDLAVSFPDLPDPARRLAVIGELQDFFRERRVDVIFLRPETAPVLRFEIFRTGVPIYEACDGLFIDETVRAIALHEDALPFRRALQRQLGERRAPK